MEADRLDDGGRTSVPVRIAGLLPFLVLKDLAYADRHKRKDVYDVIHVLKAWPGGPAEAGREIARSPVLTDALVVGALADLRARFSDAGNDGPMDYAAFMAVGEDDETVAGYRNEAVAIVDEMARALDETPTRDTAAVEWSEVDR